MNVIQSLIESNGGNDVVFEPKGLDKPLLEDAFWFEVKPSDFFEEKEGGELRFYLNGRLGLVEQATANKRKYTRPVMSREIGRLLPDMQARGVYGECDHPSDGKTKLSRVSHFVLGAEINESNEIIGKLEIIPGTKNGDQLLAIARRGGRLGVSSRGFGSVIPDDEGNHVVQEDYRLVTWDVVADPASAGAHPAFVAEERENQSMDIAKFIKEHPEVVAEIRKQVAEEVAPEAREHARVALKEEFETQLESVGKAVRQEVEEQVRAELLKDPTVAGAQGVVEQLKGLLGPYMFEADENQEIARLTKKIATLEERIAGQDAIISEQKEENTKLSSAARQMAFRLYLETSLEESVSPQAVLEHIEDLDQYQNVEEFKEAVDGIIEGMQSVIEEEQEREAELRRKDAEIAQLKEERDKALALGAQGFVRAYLEKQIAKHPRAAKVRAYVMEAKPSTKERVEALIQAYDAENPVSEEYKRLRKGLKRALAEETGEGTGVELTEDADEEELMGIPMSQLR